MYVSLQPRNVVKFLLNSLMVGVPLHNSTEETVLFIVSLSIFSSHYISLLIVQKEIRGGLN